MIWRDMVHIPSNFLKVIVHKIYLVHSWILFLICFYRKKKLNAFAAVCKTAKKIILEDIAINHFY